jgi:hypothetical protein
MEETNPKSIFDAKLELSSPIISLLKYDLTICIENNSEHIFKYLIVIEYVITGDEREIFVWTCPENRGYYKISGLAHNITNMSNQEIHKEILINTEFEKLPEDMNCYLVDSKSWRISKTDVNTIMREQEGIEVIRNPENPLNKFPWYNRILMLINIDSGW